MVSDHSSRQGVRFQHRLLRRLPESLRRASLHRQARPAGRLPACIRVIRAMPESGVAQLRPAKRSRATSAVSSRTRLCVPRTSKRAVSRRLSEGRPPGKAPVGASKVGYPAPCPSQERGTGRDRCRSLAWRRVHEVPVWRHQWGSFFAPMKAVLLALLASLRASVRSRASLQLEVLALRHQLAVFQRRPARARVEVADRLLWAWLSRAWSGWRNVLLFVQPSTVIAWQRRRFRDHWARLSRRRPGRPAVATGVRDLIRTMSTANPRWGSPRLVGELAKLRHPRGQGDRREVHGSGEEATVANLARLSPKPRQGPCLRRLLRRAHGVVQGPVRVLRARAQSTAGRALRRD